MSFVTDIGGRMTRKYKSVLDRQYFDGKTFTKYVGNDYYWWKVSSSQGKYVAGQSVSMHRYVWEFHNGEIPDGYQIHHKDHNRANNTLSNLELVETVEHCRYHMRKRAEKDPNHWKPALERAREAAKEWHKSEEGRAWHREHAKKTAHRVETHGIKMTCTWCGKTYKGLAKARKKGFCSASCQGMARNASGVDHIERNCTICNNTFMANKYSKRKTCSTECKNKAVSIYQQSLKALKF